MCGRCGQDNAVNGEKGVEESWISVARQLVQKVVIAPSADGKSADLTLHGRLAAILAAQETWREV